MKNKEFKWNLKNINRSVYFPEMNTHSSAYYSLKEIFENKIEINESNILEAILMIFEEIERMNKNEN